jgi:hypothetical protein
MNTPPPGDPDTVGMSIHGKLSHLDAIDMTKLSLSKRYAMITLSGPWISDDYGRFTTTAGANPRLPALSDREANTAIRGLIEDQLIRTWTIGGTTCWEVAGAYAFKPGLKQALWERKQLGIRKRKEKAKRKQRKEEADAGLAFTFEDDSEGMEEDGATVHKLRTARGNVIPTHMGRLWYRSNVPVPKGMKRDQMIVEQPDARPRDLNLRMLPSFNPGEGLSPLETVLRQYLLMDSDDYGRVRLDIPRLLQQLGSVITKRISRSQVEAAVEAMIEAGHLMEVRKKTGRFAFVRDSAQHLLATKRYHRDLPRLHDEQAYTYNSEAYLAFFKACEQQSTSRPKVLVRQYNLRGDLHVIEEYLHVAADRFVKEYEQLMKTEPWMRLFPQQVCYGVKERGTGYLVAYQGGPPIPSHEIRLWHAIQRGLPARELEDLLFEGIATFDDAEPSARNSTMHKIFTHLLRMTPMEYVAQQAKAESNLVPQPSDSLDLARRFLASFGNSGLLSSGDSPLQDSPPPPPLQDPPPPPAPPPVGSVVE